MTHGGLRLNCAVRLSDGQVNRQMLLGQIAG
jgi:hypothetical protein